MECQICSSGYTSNKKPKALPVCEHSYCLNCIVSLTAKSEGNFKCPACQQEFTLAPPYTLDSIDSQLITLDVSTDKFQYNEHELKRKSASFLDEPSQRIEKDSDYSNGLVESEEFSREDKKRENSNNNRVEVEGVDNENRNQEENDDYFESEVIADEDLQEDASDHSESNNNKAEEDNNELEQIGENYELNTESQGVTNDNQELNIGNDADYIEDNNAERNEEYEDLEIEGRGDEIYGEKVDNEVYEDAKQDAAYEEYDKQLDPAFIAQTNADKEWEDTYRKESNEPVHAFDLNVLKKGINVNDEQETTSKACCDFCYLI